MTTINTDLSNRLTEKQKKILLETFDTKREIPIRVVYTHEYWDTVAKSGDYSIAERELGALKNSVKKLNDYLKGKEVNIIHLGVGNGIELPIIKDGLSSVRVRNYIAVDVNPAMLEIAKAKDPEFVTKMVQRDIETDGIQDICLEAKTTGADINLVFLIANGVLFSNDHFVKEIYDRLGDQDYFFLTLELFTDGKEDEITRPYLIRPVLDLLGNGLKLLNYHPEYERFTAEIDLNDHRLKVFYTPVGESRIIVLQSYKPTLPQLSERMAEHKFHEEFCEQYDDIHTVGALYSK